MNMVFKSVYTPKKSCGDVWKYSFSGVLRKILRNVLVAESFLGVLASREIICRTPLYSCLCAYDFLRGVFSS